MAVLKLSYFELVTTRRDRASELTQTRCGITEKLRLSVTQSSDIPLAYQMYMCGPVPVRRPSFGDHCIRGIDEVLLSCLCGYCMAIAQAAAYQQQEKPVNTVWQKLFVKPLMKMMEKRDLAVAVDGSWQKRCFSSKNGLLTDTSVDTGYSGKMEVAGSLSIFQRSQSLYNVRYTKYLGDGDSKAFTSIVENKVYGDHCSVEK
ncbi:uncharacterized protein TNCV_3516141 [Trichonephila clavipes]|nr:uncharacterized protein TNCV_3516141 [Trichonephila clavipes]